MEKYYGNYLGIVVNSSDPENRNRLQVWIPNLTNTLYSNWNSTSADRILDFNFSDSDPVFIRIKNSLPWAECASPLIGGGTAMNINPAVQSRPTGDTMDEPLELPVPDEMNFNSGDGVPLEKNFWESFSNNSQETPITEDENGVVQLFQGSNQSKNELGSDGKTMEAELPKESPTEPVVVTRPTSVPTGHKANGDNVAIQSNNNITSQQFKQLSSSVKSTDRGSCVWDGSSGQCSRGVTAWTYGLTENPKLLRGLSVTGGINARDIADMSSSGNNYFQDSGSYKEKVTLDPATYKPQIGDVVASSKNHIITYLGTDENGKEIWQSDINDKSPTEYIRTGQWPSNPTLIRLNDIGLAELEDTGYVNGEYVKIAAQELNQSTEESNNVVENHLDHSIPAQGIPSPAGAAKGVVSSPTEGARVWVFFYGGDIQKPVYFALAISASEYGQANQA